jgi:N-acetylglutamate synthase-like GNAT family acetyltransferase
MNEHLDDGLAHHADWPGRRVRAPENHEGTLDLVDLQGRQDEPKVLDLLAQSHGRAEVLDEARARYQSGEWPFIGWEVAGEMVACAGAEPVDERTIGIRSIAVALAWRNRGLARALIDALAERADADQVVAETDDDAVNFHRQCSFSVSDAGSQVWSSPLLVRPRSACDAGKRLNPRGGGPGPHTTPRSTQKWRVEFNRLREAPLT